MCRRAKHGGGNVSSSYKVVMLPLMGMASGYVDRSGGGKMCHRRTTKWSLETKIIEKAPT